ncbi:MAG TPA: BTAD domain-containing putative transcriptional regulator [Casimicrobiaceae bacterium]|nr:BTAD domain-containing putative transcriptional regulator [Casimicrobiaceae bacterium]
MPEAAPTLAKLSRPKLHRAAPRERLFARLDECRKRPVVWISGPPGAGKTTTVATYVQSRRLHAAWYQADAGDGDPGTFFYYLAQLAGKSRKRERAPLPLFTAEYVGDVAGFARRFFREFFARLPANGSLVLDNYQDVTPESPFHAAFAEALGEIPDGITVFVLSRTQPPKQCARWLANDRIAQVEWKDLRLTREETAAVVAAKDKVDERWIDELHAQSNGWAAGLVLMLDRLARTGAVNRIAQSQTMDAVFNYFADQFYDQAPAEVQRVLTATAFLPAMTVGMAEALSGEANAASVLEQLHRRHLFTERKSGDDLRYEYHALFRAFLQARAQQALSAAERLDLVARSARVLDESGRPDDALPLYAENGLWDAAVDLILRNARSLIAQGRWLTLNHWIAMLPGKCVEATPELTLWRGSSLILVDPAAARAALERVFEQFAARGDTVGQLLVATGMVESCNIEFSTFQVLDPWIPVLERLLARQKRFPSVTIEIRAYAALMLAAMWRRPDHPELPRFVNRVNTLLERTDNATARADVGAQLLEYYVFTGHQAQARALIAKAGPLFEVPEVSRLRRSSWWIVVAYLHTMSGANRDAERAADKALAIAREYEQNWFGFFDTSLRVTLYLLNNATGKAAALLDQVDARLNEDRPTDVTVFSLARCMLAQLRGEARLAAHFAQRCIEASERTGAAYLRIFCPAAAAGAFVEVGECERARAVVRDARTLAEGTCYEPYDGLLLMVEAYSFLVDGDRPRAHALLERAFGRARATQSDSYFRMVVLGFRRMLYEALNAGIDVDYARSLIRKFDVAPDAPDTRGWPWPVRLETLGRFAIELDDVPLKSSGKAQRRPFDLLKFIVAMGGRQVRASAAVDALWRNFDGDAEHAFESTLHRLRKLLGRDDAIEHADGMLGLNPRVVWLDVWALERLLDQIEKGRADGALSSIPAAERLLELYRGHFLAGDEQDSFVISLQDRLRSRFLRALCLLGDRCEAEGQWVDAARLYERGLELDNLAEELYRRLIVAHEARGQRAGALEVYRRCARMLSVVLGVRPSAPIEQLYQSLKS